MFSNNLLAGVSGQGGGYTIDDSLRLNDNDSAYLTRTPTVLGSRTRFSFSAWVKRCKIGSDQALFCVTSNETNSPEAYEFRLEFSSSDVINIISYLGSYAIALASQAVYRDTSGWYHIVLAVNTYDRTSTNRVKLYVNGELQQLTGTYPASGHNTFVNTLAPHKIGKLADYSPKYFDGYIAEVIFDDNVFLTADNLGKIDSITGEWSPKQYSPPYSDTFGTNGFYLPFNGNANDDSGNGNNWTENNLASTDYMIDTPTNNFSVLNPLAKGVGLVTLEGNTELTATNSGYYAIQSSMPFSSGKWYMEFVVNARGGTTRIGGGAFKTSEVLNKSIDQMASGWFYGGNGAIYNNNSVVATVASYAVGDIIGLAFDADSGTLDFYKNGGSSLYQASVSAGEYCFGAHAYNSSDNATFNFGQDSSFAGNKTRQGNTDSNGKGDFYYTPPTGYLALCTDNLPAPAIEQPETQFNVVTYTGDGTSSNAITGVGFQPDFVWIKRRDAVQSHILSDSVRGAGVGLASESTSAEFSIPSEFLSFDSDGFTVGYSSTITNNSGSSYVAWCWKAGGTAVTNTDGSITSQVSANVDAGFSIVSWTSDGSSSNGVGHGLSETPTFFIYKTRNSVAPWYVWTTLIDGSNDQLLLNDTNSKGDIVGYGSPSSTTISNYGFGSGVELIAYCFHSVEGFSKFGTYAGNGSTNGPFVYTGFRPAFVMTKRTDSTSNWAIVDNERIGYNIDNKLIYPNLSNAESTGGVTMDLLSNGFKPRYSGADYNASAGTYIYMAFAEHPTKFSLGR